MQTQLRNQLIQELQPAAVRRGDAHSVLVTACNSVIIHHLRSVGCDYTLSVFLPECGMSKDKVTPRDFIPTIVKISIVLQFCLMISSRGCQENAHEELFLELYLLNEHHE